MIYPFKLATMQYFNVNDLDCWLIPTSRGYAPQGWSNTPKRVVRIDADGGRTKYDSIRAAARAIGMSLWSIQQVLCGKAKTAAGYRWEIEQ